MALTTYAELQAAIASWLDRYDLTANIIDFIALAEASINRDVDHWRGYSKTSITIDGRYNALPTDFIAPLRIEVGDTEMPLQPISVQDLHDRRDAREDNSGTPCFYAIVAGQLEVLPTPSASITGTITYRAKVPALSVSQTTNWVLTNFPDVYLYGALAQSAPFLVEDQRLATWGALYTQAIAALKLDNEAGRHGGAGKRKRVRS